MDRIDITRRTQDEEIMDDFSLKGEELRTTLNEIAAINKMLGGNSLTLQGVKKLLKKSKKSGTITIVDAGCGNGDMLRMLADYCNRNNISVNLIGIDANCYTVNYAEQLSVNYPNISYKCLDIFSNEFEALEYDIVLCTLTLHHFKDDEILKIISIFNKSAAIGVVINDLQRSSIAYRLFRFISRLFNLGRMARKDGLTSILRGFRKEELKAFADKLNLNNSIIEWKWAFRYQWIISKV